MTQNNKQFSTVTINKAIAKANGHCSYCRLPFGTVVDIPNSGTKMLEAVGDHFVPFSMGGKTELENCVACCSVCNMRKRDRIFESVEHCSRYILMDRIERGVTTVWMPKYPATSNGTAYLREYNAFFSRDSA